MEIPLKERLELAVLYLKISLQVNAPKDTGNLSLNGIKIEQESSKEWRIILGGELAPYVWYTNYKNASSLGWIQKTIENEKNFINTIMQGKITLEEVKDAMNLGTEELKKQIKALAPE